MIQDHNFVKYPELTDRQLQQFRFMSPHKQITDDFMATVVKVHDGDTITLRTNFRDFDFPLRLLDIDAPEMNAGGKTARDWLKDRLLDEKIKVIIDIYNRVGKYGRLLGKVFHRGMDVGNEELMLGLVTEFGQKDAGQIPNIDKELSLSKWF